MKETPNPCDSCKHEDKDIRQILQCDHYKNNPDEVSSPCVRKCPCDYNNLSLTNIMFCPHYVSDPNKDDFNEGNPPCAGKYDGEDEVAKALLTNITSSLGHRPSTLNSDINNLPRLRNGSYRVYQHSGPRSRQE